MTLLGTVIVTLAEKTSDFDNWTASWGVVFVAVGAIGALVAVVSFLTTHQEAVQLPKSLVFSARDTLTVPRSVIYTA